RRGRRHRELALMDLVAEIVIRQLEVVLIGKNHGLLHRHSTSLADYRQDRAGAAPSPRGCPQPPRIVLQNWRPPLVTSSAMLVPNQLAPTPCQRCQAVEGTPPTLTALPAARPVLTTCSTISISSGSSLAPGRPIDCDRSEVPIFRTSTPSTWAMAAMFWTAGTPSII